jgi:sugar phosphate permease
MAESTVEHHEAPEHSSAYRLRRFANWFPLGLTYAALYMGRYNLTAAKSTLGRTFHLDKAQMGVIFTVGFWVYALSVIVNGPLADRIGGRRAILIGALGAATLNGVIGLLFFSGWQQNVVLGLSVLYAINMYFQSFGALSVVKVNSSWFHVRERGVFGGIFGVMISSGYWLALSIGGVIIAKLPWYWVFLVPSMALLGMFVVDFLLVRDRPSAAGQKDFDTGDGSFHPDEDEKKGYRDNAPPAADEKPLPLSALLGKIFSDPVIRVIAAAEFCTGFVRQGLLIYFLEYLAEVHNVRPGSSVHAWAGVGPTLGGIAGGLVCGVLSDRFFSVSTSARRVHLLHRPGAGAARLGLRAIGRGGGVSRGLLVHVHLRRARDAQRDRQHGLRRTQSRRDRRGHLGRRAVHRRGPHGLRPRLDLEDLRLGRRRQRCRPPPARREGLGLLDHPVLPHRRLLDDPHLERQAQQEGRRSLSSAHAPSLAHRRAGPLRARAERRGMQAQAPRS